MAYSCNTALVLIHNKVAASDFLFTSGRSTKNKVKDAYDYKLIYIFLKFSTGLAFCISD